MRTSAGIETLLALADQLEQIAGDDPRTLFTLGLSLAEGRQYARAVQLFERTNTLVRTLLKCSITWALRSTTWIDLMRRHRL